MYDETFKIIIFGDQNVGKESITQRYLTNLFVSDSKMTIGVDFEVKSLIVNNQNVKLQIWDFGGEERFRFLLPTYVKGARGGLFFYDITNYSSLAHIDDWLTIIKKEIRKEDVFPIIVVGNNAHLAEQRKVPTAEAIKIAKSRGVDGFIEISGETGENVQEAFEALTRLMLNDTGPVELEPVEVRPAVIVKTRLEQVKESVHKYIDKKSQTNKQIIRTTTINAVKKSLGIAGNDKSWDDEIWSITNDFSKSICKRTTSKTIYFK